MRILALSGSLRLASTNTALLAAAAALAPAGVTVEVFDGLGALPHFNPDLEGAEPAVVRGFHAAVRAADGLLVSAPEYAHGLPGVLKNALDWLVGSTDFPGKPVAIFNASPWATHAPAALREILAVMNARLIDEASVTLPLQGRHLDAAGIQADPAFAAAVRTALAAFARAIAAPPHSGSRKPAAG
jgi:chromate reductase, NAD(P)H dehydrogenase (quinone)